jgi:voltage-gated potassium channel
MVISKDMDNSVSSLGPRKVIRGLVMLIGILILGTAGYMVIERWQLLDAIYMTVISITTVGFKEVRDVSEAGRIFTLIIIFTGMGIMAYTLGMVAQVMVEFQVRSIFGRRKLGSKIKSLKNHYIICGYGRIGRIIAQELEENGIPLLVIDNDPESKQALDTHEIPYIIDDATSEDILIEAGIERAKGLVAVVLSDADNLFITITARGLNPELFILARTDEDHARRKLLRAGANRVVMPYRIGGQKMAHTIIRPAVTEFLEFTVDDQGIELKMEELLVGEKSRLDGVTLADSGIRQEMNIIIVAIRKKDGEMKLNPSSESRIEIGDTLIALGHSNELRRLSSILSGN